MIPNHHTLNIASKGRHWARIKFADLEDEVAVKFKAQMIIKAMQDAWPHSEWSFTLTKVECYGREVDLG